VPEMVVKVEKTWKGKAYFKACRNEDGGLKRALRWLPKASGTAKRADTSTWRRGF